MAHLIGGAFLVIVMYTIAIFLWGWVSHERVGRDRHNNHQMALALPSIERSRPPEPTTPAVVHVHLHQDPRNLWGHGGDTWNRPSWHGDVIDAQIVELPAAQG